MKKFRVRLTIIFIALVGFSVLMSGLFVAQVFKKSHYSMLESNMAREINVINVTFPWNQAGTDEVKNIDFLSKETNRLSVSSGARVTFIRSDGKVLGDSGYDVTKMNNHLNRVEVALAKKNGVGSEIRYSDTLHVNMMYVAVPVDNRPYFDGYIRLAVDITDVEKGIQSLWYGLALGLVVLFIIAGLISYRLAHHLTKPLEKITRVADQISHMNYRSRVEINNHDEIGQLGTAINAMADSLQIQVGQIHENENRLKNVLEHMINGILMVDPAGNIVLVNKMAENILGLSAKRYLGKHYSDVKQQYEIMKMIEEGLEKRDIVHDEVTIYFPDERQLEVNIVPMFWEINDFGGILLLVQDLSAIRRLERVRSEFVANVSHELKTPVAAVKGFAETLLSGAVTDQATANSFLQIIYDESERLNRLIGDILELSKIESKRVPLQFSPVDLHVFVTSLADVLSPEAAKKHIVLDVDVPEHLYAEADEDRLRQIIINLVSNGINYTPEGGAVHVKVEAIGKTKDGEDERIRFTIKDTGIGIPKQDLPRIFERFYRVDKARSRSSGGTGLGLSIVKHLVDSHEGTIRVESELGIGSKFIFEIPIIHEISY